MAILTVPGKLIKKPFFYKIKNQNPKNQPSNLTHPTSIHALWIQGTALWIYEALLKAHQCHHLAQPAAGSHPVNYGCAAVNTVSSVPTETFLQQHYLQWKNFKLTNLA